MNLRPEQRLYFGPLTVLIEWLGIMAVLSSDFDFNFDNAISTLTSAPQPLPIIFGLTLTLAGTSYAVFASALDYSRYIFSLSLVAGLALALTGWIPFRGGFEPIDLLHSLAALAAGGGYVGITWLLRRHPHRPIGRLSKTITYVAVVCLVASSVNNVFVHKYVAFTQLAFLFLLQAWTVFVVWHELQYIDDNTQLLPKPSAKSPNLDPKSGTAAERP